MPSKIALIAAFFLAACGLDTNGDNDVTRVDAHTPAPSAKAPDAAPPPSATPTLPSISGAGLEAPDAGVSATADASAPDGSPAKPPPPPPIDDKKGKDGDPQVP